MLILSFTESPETSELLFQSDEDIACKKSNAKLDELTGVKGWKRPQINGQEYRARYAAGEFRDINGKLREYDEELAKDKPESFKRVLHGEDKWGTMEGDLIKASQSIPGPIIVQRQKDWQDFQVETFVFFEGKLVFKSESIINRHDEILTGAPASELIEGRQGFFFAQLRVPDNITFMANVQV